MEIITLTRPQLYDLVWKEPMLSLSKRFKISDVGLRKMCRRLNIPVPQAGHWQKVKFGKKLSQVKLPKDFDGKNTVSLEIRNQQSEIDNRLPSFRSIKEEIKSDPRLFLTVPEKLTNPDKLIVAARNQLLNHKEFSRYQGVLTTHGETIDIRVSKKFVARSLRFMDTLIKALKTRGHDIQIQSSGWKKITSVVMGEQNIRILFRERLNRVIVNNGRYNSTELQPSGVLYFRLEGENSREWTDNETPFENFLPDIVAKLELEGHKMKILASERQKAREKREAEERIRKELEKRRLEEFNDFKNLLGKLPRWQKARQLREYLNELEKSAIANDSITSEFNNWISRAREKTDWYDPMIEKADKWLDGFKREDLDTPQIIERLRW
jgi:hypothetical protein